MGQFRLCPVETLYRENVRPVISGNQWRNFGLRVPEGKGWLGALLIKCLGTVQKIEASNARKPWVWGPVARLRAPVGCRGKAPGGSAGGEASGSSCVF